MHPEKKRYANPLNLFTFAQIMTNAPTMSVPGSMVIFHLAIDLGFTVGCFLANPVSS